MIHQGLFNHIKKDKAPYKTGAPTVQRQNVNHKLYKKLIYDAHDIIVKNIKGRKRLAQVAGSRRSLDMLIILSLGVCKKVRWGPIIQVLRQILL